MRIEAYTQVQKAFNPKNTNKAKEAAKTGRSDQLQISTVGKDIQTAKQAVANSPDVRTDVTAPIKASIKSGTYNVSGESFADKLLEQYNEFNEMR